MYNKISLMGRLTNATEPKMTQNGIPFVRFRISVNRRYREKGEDAVADFFNTTAWRGTAEFICKYFGKGNMIMLDGEMRSSQYNNKNGNPTMRYGIVVRSVSFTGDRTCRIDFVKGKKKGQYGG